MASPTILSLSALESIPHSLSDLGAAPSILWSHFSVSINDLISQSLAIWLVVEIVFYWNILEQLAAFESWSWWMPNILSVSDQQLCAINIRQI